MRTNNLEKKKKGESLPPARLEFAPSLNRQKKKQQNKHENNKQNTTT